MTSGSAYTPIGGEMVLGDGMAKTATLNEGINISKDGTQVEITAYLIGGSNFVRLRDVMRLFNIGVTFESGTIGIDTSKAYAE